MRRRAGRILLGVVVGGLILLVLGRAAAEPRALLERLSQEGAER